MNAPLLPPAPASQTRLTLDQLERYAAALRELEVKASPERKPVLAKEAELFEKLAAHRRLREG